MTQTSAFVALSRFTVANDLAGDVKAAFRQRPHLVDTAPGFARMEVISPQDRPEEIWLVTWWRDRESFETWHRSHLYRESHNAMPKGLKLVSGETQMRYFDHICS
jgi:heme oxygenase (mycobilin-producing)